MRALLRNPGPALHATRIVYIFYLKEFTHKFGLDWQLEPPKANISFDKFDFDKEVDWDDD